MLTHRPIIRSYSLVRNCEYYANSTGELNVVLCMQKCVYCIRVSDADSPSRKNAKNRSFQHWIIGNIPGNNVAAGETLTECMHAVK